MANEVSHRDAPFFDQRNTRIPLVLCRPSLPVSPLPPISFFYIAASKQLPSWQERLECQDDLPLQSISGAAPIFW
jgi:hypothetical protein